MLSLHYSVGILSSISSVLFVSSACCPVTSFALFSRFTPREVARIQSFPETFELIGTESAQYRALGNAIPPVMIWYVANKVQSMLSSK